MSIFNCRPMYEADYERIEERLFAATGSLKEFEIPGMKLLLRELLNPFIVKGFKSRLDLVTSAE